MAQHEPALAFAQLLPDIAPRPQPIAPAPAPPVAGSSSSGSGGGGGGNVAASQSPPQDTHSPESDDDGGGGGGAGSGGKKKSKSRRRKVNHACLYCRRSHMTCDEGRPCQRCIKREIGHLCHDERRANMKEKQPQAIEPVQSQRSSTAPAPTLSYAPPPTSSPWPTPTAATSADPHLLYSGMYAAESFGKEFSSLSDFLETLDEQAFFNPTPAFAPDPAPPPPLPTPSSQQQQQQQQHQQQQQQHQQQHQPPPSSHPHRTSSPPPLADTPDAVSTTTTHGRTLLSSASMTEKFLLTAADQEPGPRNERLKRVIRTKYEAGLLKPYDYVKGYARLSRWMDKNVSQDSKQQILHPLSVLRPKFRAIAQSLRDLDLVFIEEAFERLMLDYDRVFSVMGIPACLWRRTGEIYKGNREFAELVGVDGYMLRDGRLCIYELMAEESAVNYWEKYGNVAFDSSQKAVLTSCVLRYKPRVTDTTGATTSNGVSASGVMSASGMSAGAGAGVVGAAEDALISCCFSFTIRRDMWGIPSMIVGNFIRL